jgi:hypothetical protein
MIHGKNDMPFFWWMTEDEVYCCASFKGMLMMEAAPPFGKIISC